ncbi:DNA repair and recombination protein RAD54B [Lingula anatina]|uniref:DNA repair and recombination protein RAD54B n=1 Tax=Lingula anatina TaxID=7574 RepID=A0A1S3HBS5_LINAN|nr:DNA repair and recombination protein RAD54B [Lingula anatina]|eukprot:XP_013382594.1 DNA repair and recombination protein RAD54B [Lingula anatina]
MKRSAAPSQQGAAKKRFKPPFLATPGTENTSSNNNDQNFTKPQNPSLSGVSSKAINKGHGVGVVTLHNHANIREETSDNTDMRCTPLQSRALRLVQLSTWTGAKPGVDEASHTITPESGNVSDLKQDTSFPSTAQLLPGSINEKDVEDLRSLKNSVFKSVPRQDRQYSSCGPQESSSSSLSRRSDSTSSQSTGSSGRFLSPASNVRSKVEGAEPLKQYFTVMWAKLTKKKHKTWEGDGILVISGRSATLQDMEGKEICCAKGYKAEEVENLPEGATLKVGSKEVEITGSLTTDAYTSGRCFNAVQKRELSKQEKPKLTAPVAPKPFTCPLPGHVESKSKLSQSQTVVTPRFDPMAPGALVMLRPLSTHQWQFNKNGTPVVDVVVDPHVACHLRPHQREGVAFLYQCVMGMREHVGQGAILADEMGLGKTLQCIALIWTLLKQGPYGGKAVVKRVLVVTPGSLVKNWCHEFHKWLGKERLAVFAVTKEKKVKDFLTSFHPVLVVSYEMLVRHIEHIRQVKFDLIVCDEGHRLKNSSIKTTSLMSSLSVQRRVVLTGTPIQNDLQEFFSLVDFCNPGILGTSSAFHNIYEVPILASRQPGALPEELELGRTRSDELSQLTKQFILRRTQEVNDQYLPPKVEYVVFCRPSEVQLQLYRQILKSQAVRRCLQDVSNTASHLVGIGALKKLCNHPCLIYEAARETEESSERMDMSSSPFIGLLQHFPDSYSVQEPSSDEVGKLTVLLTLLSSIVQSQEKVVVVSNYTKTLDILETIVKGHGYKFLRLDGQTPTDKRQEIVNLFNSKYSQHTVFLLSSKAGGIGLNLIGASRIVLYDIDWNPATDLQAMARVWRDGQKRTVHIYRLITTGTIEEKIYQRQIIKQGLSGAVVDSKIDGSIGFSQDELRDIFTLHEDSACVTHDMLQCECSGRKVVSLVEPSSSCSSSNRQCQLGINKASVKKHFGMENLLDWEHKIVPEKGDPLCAASDWITMIFKNERASSQLNKEVLSKMHLEC